MITTNVSLVKVLVVHDVGSHKLVFPLQRRAFGHTTRTTPNPAYQRADGVDPTGLADQNQKKLASNLEMRLNKARTAHE